MAKTKSAPAAGGKKRNGAVDLLRFLFTLFVVMAHMDSSLYKGEWMPFANGHISVELFFALSGFLMAAKVMSPKTPEYEKGSLGGAWWEFFRHKFVSLYPVWFVAQCAFLVGVAFQGKFRWDLVPRAASGFLMMTGLGLQDTSVIPFSWYVPAMMITSALLFPLLYRFRKGFTMMIAPLIAVFCLLHLYRTYGKVVVIEGNGDNGDWIPILGYPKIVRALCGLCLGCCAQALSQWMKERFSGRLTKAGRIVFTVVELLLWAFPIILIYKGVPVYMQLPMLLAYNLGLAFSFADLGWTGTVLSGSFFNWLGRYSYAAYLAQFIPNKYLKLYCDPADKPLFVALYLAADLVFALAFMYAAELLRFLFRKGKAALGRLCLQS